ncbi:MAG: undecaprenyl-diphosphate phosphatase [Bdellovibrionota bacterium]|nr:undecaprenyl-diphosphate phosphatase [Pseudomonadota bacterium]MDY6091239.1 undecaprenyl-diphosphate phosphatase [Bdellovibrionota bacterium]
MNDIVNVVLLGIIEGLTEFIPVSSTGHLIIFGNYLNLNDSLHDTFEIFIQLGAILAVLFLYFKRFILFFDFKNKDDAFAGKQGLLKMFLACVPVFVMGFLFYHSIKALLTNIPLIALALIVGGILMIIVEKIKIKVKTHGLNELTYKDSFLIGIFQCLSLWPGFSRSASTIIGGMFLGVKREVSAKFSFLVAVPVIFAAVIYDICKNFANLSKDDIWFFLIGFIVSFFVAIFSIKFFLNILKKFSLTIFGYYRIILGFIVLLVYYL